MSRCRSLAVALFRPHRTPAWTWIDEAGSYDNFEISRIEHYLCARMEWP